MFDDTWSSLSLGRSRGSLNFSPPLVLHRGRRFEVRSDTWWVGLLQTVKMIYHIADKNTSSSRDDAQPHNLSIFAMCSAVNFAWDANRHVGR